MIASKASVIASRRKGVSEGEGIAKGNSRSLTEESNGPPNLSAAR